MRITLLALLTGFAVSGSAMAHDFLPPNNLDLQDDVNFAGGISEADFNAVIDQAEAYYASVFAGHGGTLRVERKWRDGTVNASAMRMGRTWVVNMYGGLARRPEVTKDGFAMVLCHEIGHHVAGFPFSSSWAANEGQSDYFALQSCARELWGKETELNAKAAASVPEAGKKLCDARFQKTDDQNLCYRQMAAGVSLATLLGNLGGDRNVSIDTPDQSEVDSTDDQHPAAQCRLDTYVAGTLCTVKFDPNSIPQTEAQSNKVSCGADDARATRPRCWFAPNSSVTFQTTFDVNEVHY